MSSIIMRLDQPDQHGVAEMGIRHIQYGVKPSHYKMVGEAMLWMLSKALGSEWDHATATAWLQCYEELTVAMTQKIIHYDSSPTETHPQGNLSTVHPIIDAQKRKILILGSMKTGLLFF